MAKPVILFKAPARNFPQSSPINELLIQLQDRLEKKMPDYHVFVISTSNSESSIEVFNSRKAKDIDIEQLKEELKHITLCLF